MRSCILEYACQGDSFGNVMAIQQEVLSAEVMNFVIPIYFVEDLALAAVFFALRSTALGHENVNY